MKRVKQALGNPAEDEKRRSRLFSTKDTSYGKRLETIRTRDAVQYGRLFTRLSEAAEPLKLSVVACEDEAAVGAEIGRLVREKSPEWGSDKAVCAWRHPLIDRLNLPEVLGDLQVPITFSEAAALA